MELKGNLIYKYFKNNNENTKLYEKYRGKKNFHLTLHYPKRINQPKNADKI